MAHRLHRGSPMRHIIHSTPLAAFALLVAACNTSKTPEEARKDAKEALSEHREAVIEAREEPPVEEAKEIAAANEELAEDYADAYENVEPDHEKNHEPKTAANEPEGDDQGADLDERFDAIRQSETDAEFAARARKTIAALERDLAATERRVDDPAAVERVEKSIANAKEDLEEIEGPNAEVLDDGKLGIAVSINTARRRLDRLDDDAK